MHYANATYDALVQQWAHAVRLTRRSALCAAAAEHGIAGALRLCGGPGPSPAADGRRLRAGGVPARDA